MSPSLVTEQAQPAELTAAFRLIFQQVEEPVAICIVGHVLSRPAAVLRGPGSSGRLSQQGFRGVNIAFERGLSLPK